MASLEVIKALGRAYLRQDSDWFAGLLLQVAEKTKNNDSLKDLASRIKLAKPRTLASLNPNVSRLTREVPIVFSSLDSLLQRREVKDSLEDFIEEHLHREKLAEAGMSPAYRLLLSGPPGTGKTMTAQILAARLDLPLLQIETHEIIDSLMGATAANVGKVFAEIAKVDAVWLFDEFDSLGLSRGGHADGKAAGSEIHRTTNTILQMLERPIGNRSIFVATTNLGRSIDRAISRRFDQVIEYGNPTENEAITLIDRVFGLFFVTENKSSIRLHNAIKNTQFSHAQLETICNRVRKSWILGRCPAERILERLADGIMELNSETV